MIWFLEFLAAWTVFSFCIGIPIGLFLKRCSSMAGFDEAPMSVCEVSESNFVLEQREILL